MSTNVRFNDTAFNFDHNIHILSAVSERKLVEKPEVIDLRTGNRR